MTLTPLATHWGTYLVETADGVLKDVRGHPIDEDPSPIGRGFLEAVTHRSRIGHPAVRKGFLEKRSQSDRSWRGAEPFVRVSWEEALDLAASELDRVRKAHGNAAIFGGSYGWASAGRFHHAQSQLHRFLNTIGGYTASIDTYSYAAVSALMPHIVGPFGGLVLDQATAWPVIAGQSELIVMLGGMALKNTQVNAGGVGRHNNRAAMIAAARRGARFVNVSPLRSDADPELGAEWLAVRPGTDTALLLGLAHTLLAEGLYDRQFLTRYTSGYERFEPYLLGTSDGVPKDAGWAARICGIPAESILSLARRMAGARTMITVAWSLQRADHGEQPCWMAVVLAAMLGQIGLPGGGFGIGYACANGVGNAVSRMSWPALPQGRNPVEGAIPVARISDALLNPGAPYDFNGRRCTYPDLKLIYWAGGNPFHHHQDLNRLLAALRVPETIIVNEIWWTPLARHADIVLPATSPLERDDIVMVRWDPAIVANGRAIAPVGEARDDYDILTGLARRLGVEEPFTEGRSAKDWIDWLWAGSSRNARARGFDLPSLGTFRSAGGVMERPAPSSYNVLLADFRRDPLAHKLPTPSGRIEIFSDEIAAFGYDDCPGHPTWIEPFERLGGAGADRHPLHLVSNQPATRLHGQLDCGGISAASKVNGREPITLHPADAAERGIAAGDVVRVFNDRGACLAGVRISDAVMRGCVQMSTGATYDPDEPGRIGALCKHGNVNVLTRDKGTSRLGQGPSAHTCLVEVARWEGPLPPVTAFEPPAFTGRSEAG
jgi:biotin/methionine sulfoxide reductase